MAQAVGRGLLTTETLVRSRSNPLDICGGQSGTGTESGRVPRVSPVSVTLSILRTLLRL
jgi:hypothetical protein